VLHVALRANTGAVERDDLQRASRDFGQKATPSRDLRHRSTERMTGEPQVSFVGYLQQLFKMRPQVIDFALEPAVNTTDRFGQIWQGIGVSLDVVPLVRLGASAGDDAVDLVGEDVRLGPVPFDELGIEADDLGSDRRLILGELRNHRDLDHQQRTMQAVEVGDLAAEPAVEIEFDFGGRLGSVGVAHGPSFKRNEPVTTTSIQTEQP
jgi:hypothetical protein